MISDNTPNETFKDNVRVYYIRSPTSKPSVLTQVLIIMQIWTQKFGEEAMPKALTYARAVDKQPKL